MNRIEELLEFVKDEIDDNNYRRAVIKVYDVYGSQEGDPFLYFLLDCWFDGLIENPLKEMSADDLGVEFISESIMKNLFEQNKHEFEDEIKYRWFLPSHINIMPTAVMSIGLGAYFLGYPIYYCKEEGNFSGERAGFLVLDKGMTFNQWLDDINQFDGAVDYPTHKEGWKELK